MLNDLLNSGITAWVLLVLAAGLLVYALATIWSQVGQEKLLWQNLFRSNPVELPRLGRPLAVPATGTDREEGTALVLSRAPVPLNPDQPVARDFTNVIYPVAGRNGLHFTPERCSSCGLCAYVCPVGAVSTPAQAQGYLRRFDLKTCIYCGLCEAACPTTAIRLTINNRAVQADRAAHLVQGEVKFDPCQVCGRPTPQPDLLGERIYELQTLAGDHDYEEEAQDEFERRHRAVNPGGVCLECQKKVLEAEERICG